MVLMEMGDRHGANLARGMAAAIEISRHEPKVQQKCFKAEVSMALINIVVPRVHSVRCCAIGMMKAEQAGQDLLEVQRQILEMIKKHGHAQALVKKTWWMFGIRLLKLSNRSANQ